MLLEVHAANPEALGRQPLYQMSADESAGPRNQNT
jgi:hypothetical protein